MDFVDYEAFLSAGPDVADNGELGLLPQPQPALALPLASNIENIGKRFSSLNTLTRTLWAGDSDPNSGTGEKPGGQAQVDEQLQSKYASLSLSMLNIHPGASGAASDSTRDNASSLSANSLSERLGRVLNNQLSDTELRDIFSNLQDRFGSDAQFFGDLVSSAVPGSVARKSLRGRVHRELIKAQGAALKEYEPAVMKIRSAGEAMDRLKATALQTNTNIDANYAGSRQIDADIAGLSQKKTELATKKALLSSCKATFTVDEYSQHVLAAGDIDQEFFAALERAEKVSANCSVLLSLENSLLGLKLLEHANRAITKSVERILQFTNKTLANLYSLNVDNRLQTLHRCLRYLKDRLNYLQDVVDTFSNARSQKLLSDFASQTDAAPSDEFESDARPIFVAAHDPVRYLGDLLAYIHSLVVNEQETIGSVFSTGDEKDAHEFESIVSTISDRVLLTLAQPLEVRAQRALLGETSLDSVLALYNLLDLYAMMLGKQLDHSSALLVVIQDLIRFAQNRFAIILSDHLAALQQSAHSTPLAQDLHAPDWLIDFYAQVLPTIGQTSGSTIMNVSALENARLLALVLDKPIEVFEALVQDQIAGKHDQLIARLNFHDIVLSKTMPLQVLRDKVLTISDQMYVLEQALREVVLTNLLEQCKMHHFYNVCNMICPVTDEFFDASIYSSVGENKLCDKHAFAAANEAVGQVVPSALLDVQLQLVRLNSPRTVNDVLAHVFLGFTDFYYKLGCIGSEIYSAAWSWLDMEIATMLGVEDEYIERKIKVAETMEGH